MIYLELMRNQNMIHLAVQENEFDCQLYAWQEILPLYFATNHVSHARYNSYYVEMLNNLDQSHPGLRKLLLKDYQPKRRKNIHVEQQSIEGGAKYKSRS